MDSSRYAAKNAIEKRKERKDSYNYLCEESARLGTSREPMPEALPRRATEPLSGSSKEKAAEMKPEALPRRATEPLSGSSKDKNIKKSEVLVESFLEYMRPRTKNDEIKANRELKDKAVNDFVTNYETLKAIHGCLYEPLRIFYKSDREVSGMLIMHGRDIKWENLKKAYLDINGALEQLKKHDLNLDFQRLWAQVDQAKKEIMRAKEKIQNEISFGRRGQAAKLDITHISRHIETEILPVLQDPNNSDPNALEINLNALSEKIYDLVINKAQRELEAVDFFLNHDPKQQHEKDSIQIAEPEYVTRARKELQQVKDGLQAIGKSAKDKFRLINDLVENYQAMSDKLYNTTANINELANAIRAFRNPALSITGKDILNIVKKFYPPPDLVHSHEQLSKEYWERIALSQAMTEKKRIKTTDPEFETYYREICKRADQKPLDLTKDTQIWMRHKPDAFLQILKDGRIKSQFETDTSGGTIDKEGRAKIERRLYGYPSDLPADMRPVYGYETDDKTGKSWNVGGYGPIAIRLKVKDRAYRTMGDSYDIAGLSDTWLYVRPVPCEEQGRDCFPVGTNSTNVLNFKHLNDIRAIGADYMEVHIHGGVIVDDVEEVVFHMSDDNSPLINDIKRRLSNLGIGYKFVAETA